VITLVRPAFAQLPNLSVSSSLLATMTTSESGTVVTAPAMDTAVPFPVDWLVILIGVAVFTPRNAAMKPEM
jgi:hypothetical protein